MRTLACLALLSLSLGGCAEMRKSKASAEAAIVRFHQSWDASDFGGIWDSGSAQLQATPRAQMIEQMVKIRGVLGTLRSTSNRGWKVSSKDAGYHIDSPQLQRK